MMTFHSHFEVFGYENLILARIISPLLVFWRRKNVIGEIIRLFLFYHLILHHLFDFTSPHHYNINTHALKFDVVLLISLNISLQLTFPKIMIILGDGSILTIFMHVPKVSVYKYGNLVFRNIDIGTSR